MSNFYKSSSNNDFGTKADPLDPNTNVSFSKFDKLEDTTLARVALSGRNIYKSKNYSSNSDINIDIADEVQYHVITMDDGANFKVNMTSSSPDKLTAYGILVVFDFKDRDAPNKVTVTFSNNIHWTGGLPDFGGLTLVTITTPNGGGQFYASQTLTGGGVEEDEDPIWFRKYNFKNIDDYITGDGLAEYPPVCSNWLNGFTQFCGFWYFASNSPIPDDDFPGPEDLVLVLSTKKADGYSNRNKIVIAFKDADDNYISGQNIEIDAFVDADRWEIPLSPHIVWGVKSIEDISFVRRYCGYNDDSMILHGLLDKKRNIWVGLDNKNNNCFNNPDTSPVYP